MINLSEFVRAALPWIALGVAVAVACAYMGQAKKKSGK